MQDELIEKLLEVSIKAGFINIFTYSTLGMIHNFFRNIFIENAENRLDISSSNKVDNYSINLQNIENVEYDYDYDSNSNIARITARDILIEIFY